LRIFGLGFLRIFEKIISQNQIFFFEEKWLILAGKRGETFLSEASPLRQSITSVGATHRMSVGL
jgi:hypothetical protein